MMSRTLFALAMIVGLAACSDSGTEQQTSANQQPQVQGDQSGSGNQGTTPTQ